MTKYDLTSKVAIITGASRGIGAAIAQAFAEAGSKVVVASRELAAVRVVADDINAAGGSALAVATHMGDWDAVANLVDAAVSTYGGVDIAVNNAATNPHFGPLLTAEESHWDKVLDVNVKGYYRLAQLVTPHMIERSGGSIINIASIAGINPGPGMGVYSVSKAAVLMLTRALATELAPSGVRVNAIAPGVIKTKFSTALWTNERMVKHIEARARRLGEPDDVSGAALFLASDAAAYISGTTITIDGGTGVI
ncbi:MAG: SDR family oxidoreductase [Herpetosiphonaceae bacterium]|nr:SDR family oxidoreductase [Herpetosiphonaceae bacterium]